MRTKGFTLIEMLISVAIFTVVMTMALGSLLAMSESDRKAQSMKSVINNLNFALDALSRSARAGIVYHCAHDQDTLTLPRDCTNPPGGAAPTAASSFAFQGPDINSTVQFCLGIVTPLNISCLSSDTVQCPAGSSCSVLRSLNYPTDPMAPITSGEVNVTSLIFYVIGSSQVADDLQPKVTMLLSGSVVASGDNTTVFNVQTSVTQRIYDE